MEKQIIFGGIYRAKRHDFKFKCKSYNDRLNDQNYNYWYPVKTLTRDGTYKIYMVDTYQFRMEYKYQFSARFDNTTFSKYDEMVKYLQSLGSEEDRMWLASKTSDYYYSARVELTDYNFEVFELMADLKDYIPVNDKERRYYNEDEVTEYMMFWNYQNSGRGISLRKKDAKFRYDFKIDRLIMDIENEISRPNIRDYEIDKLLECEKEAIAKNADYDKNRVEYILKLQKYINRINKNYSNYRKRLTKELEDKQ